MNAEGILLEIVAFAREKGLPLLSVELEAKHTAVLTASDWSIPLAADLHLYTAHGTVRIIRNDPLAKYTREMLFKLAEKAAKYDQMKKVSDGK